jgi:hypothetical protein
MENQWRAAEFSVRLYCAYEKKKVRGVLIVDRLSGTRNCDGPSLPINEDHFGIVKPNDATHASYVALRNAIKSNPKPSAKRTKPNPPPAINSNQETARESKVTPVEPATTPLLSPPNVSPPVAKTQDQTQTVGPTLGLNPEDLMKAERLVDRMRNSLTAVLGKKDTITFLMSWPDDDNTYLVFISSLLSNACRTTPRECWFTQPGDGHNLDKPPVHGSGARGITVHGPDADALAVALGAWFTTYSTSAFPPQLNGYKEEATKEIIWIEIGPGSPWKPITK